jgi:hypothetical protein
VSTRAVAVAAHHQQRSTDAFGRMRDLQQQANAIAPSDAARAAELRRQAAEASRLGRRHEALRARAAGIAGNTSWQRPTSGRTPQQLEQRRAAFVAIRQELRASAERDNLLPEMAETQAERVRRAELMRQSLRQLARERLGDLAEPAERGRS